MKRSAPLSLIFLTFLFSGLRAQTVTGIVPKKDSFHSFFSVGSAVSWSVIDNRMEIRGAYKTGIDYKLAFHPKEWFYWSIQYTRFGVHVAHPALEDIHSWNAELNGNMLFNLGRSNLKFKTVFGFGLMDWYGTYVGPCWNDNRTYKIGMQLTDHWVFGTVGCGLEHDLGRMFSVSGDFRFRFASDEQELISISDTAFFVALDWNLRKPLPPAARNSTDINRKKKNGKKRSGIYRWLNSR